MKKLMTAMMKMRTLEEFDEDEALLDDNDEDETLLEDDEEEEESFLED